jgi:predicted CXXCH cytochrome family protein
MAALPKHRAASFCLVLSVLCPGLAAAGPEKDPHTSASGEAVCVACHRTMLVKKVHPHPPMQQGCRSCHTTGNPASKKLLATPIAALCRSCHSQAVAKQEQRLHLAFAAGECTSCHDAHGSDRPAMLKARQEVVCFACHADAEPRFLRTYTHAPVWEGKCTACHAGHGAPAGNLLKASGAALCQPCHAGLVAGTAGSSHQPFAAGKCLECHDAHGSDIRGMLREHEKTTCSKCHPDELTSAQSIHAPFAAGECTKCHGPHEARLPKLLRAGNPQLCFPCHESMRRENAAGRPHAGDCSACHEPHRAAQEHLLRQPPSETCKKCHDGAGVRFARAHLVANARDTDCVGCHAAHGSENRSLLKSNLHAPFARRRCDRCHDAAATSEDKLRKGASGAICFGCHRDLQKRLKGPSVHTAVRQATCVACHDPHASGRTSECATCHGEVVPVPAKSVHRPAAEGRCVDCHDPHASPFAFQLVREGDQLCAGCHQRIASAVAKSTRKHRQACVACHEPHGSAASVALLKAEIPALCLRCHDAKSASFASGHAGYPVGSARCTECHDPHGSDRKGLLAASMHEPVAKADCAACHEPEASPAPLAIKKSGAALCRDCHGPAIAAMSARMRLHQPVAEGACLACHAPHGSKERGLLRDGMAATCGGCHRDTIERARLSQKKHGPIREGRCTRCHDPHASDIPLLLVTRSPYEMCLSCHTTQRHPHIVGSSRDPQNPNLKLECPSCHRAHGTGYANLLPYAKREQLCANCHLTKK